MCIDGATATEHQVSTMYGGCWPDFGHAAYAHYGMTDDSWDDAGKFDGCNITKPFAKVINSLFLICHGLADNAGGAAACRQWHSSGDYWDLVHCGENRFHGPFYVRFIEYDGADPADTELRRFLARDRTNLHCPLFNRGANFDSPVARAAALLHEAWHHWQYEHDIDPQHQAGPRGECDWYYVNHAWTWGQMDTYDTEPTRFRFLSPYQVMVDFLDDLHIFHAPALAIGSVLEARTTGNLILEQKFKNPPKFRIGTPKPF